VFNTTLKRDDHLAVLDKRAMITDASYGIGSLDDCKNEILNSRRVAALGDSLSA
jgi:hypothetical protein